MIGPGAEGIRKIVAPRRGTCCHHRRVTDYQIRRATAVDDVLAATPLFDNPAKPEWAQRFLTEPGHHLLLAWVQDRAVGFVSGVETTHPDKGTEMFLYELGVDEEHRNRGIGRELVAELKRLAAERGCYDMWVLTDRDNRAALKAYRAAGATDESDHVMLTFNL
jgi:[ribosomal protein S18]-alanine N-acetyltransferase